MSKEKYTIPVNPTACMDFESNAINLCNANAVSWNIPNEKLTVVNLLRTNYEKTYVIANNRSTQSPAATAARDASWELLKPALIELYDHYILNNNNISAADKEALHIHYAVGGGGAPSPAPSTTPNVTLTSKDISVLRAIYSDSASSGSHAKPANVAFCELWYKVDGPPPTEPKDCPERHNISRSHENIVFTPADRGKTVYGYAHWVNKNGKTGPWSGQITAMVP